MIQFNLLPDIKLEYIKAKRTKRTVVVIASTVTGLSFAIFLLLFITVNVLQKKHISDLTNDINSKVSELESIEDLDKILTVQNQLNNLTGLHEQKPVATRLFTYLPQLVPEQASLTDLNLSFEESLIEFSGDADSLTTVNKFVDTLKFTEYTIDEQKTPAFSDVVLADFSATEGGVSFDIELKFDPYIFNSANSVTLTVPNIISTRSETEKPSEDIFSEPLEVNEDSGEAQ